MTFQNLSSRLWRISRCFHHMLSCSQTCHRGCSTHIGGYGWSVLQVTHTHQRPYEQHKHTHRHQRWKLHEHIHFRDHERWTGYPSHTNAHFRDRSEKLSLSHTAKFKYVANTSETMTGHLNTLSHTLAAYSRNYEWRPKKLISWFLIHNYTWSCFLFVML